MAIAPLDTALTFARTEQDGVRRRLAVTRYERAPSPPSTSAGRSAVSSRDPIELVLDAGTTPCATPSRARPTPRVWSSARRISIIPVDLGDHHVAAGTNYPEHAGEAEVEDGPFLFAKLVQPTGPRASVPAGAALLDYEVELAWVTLEPLAHGATPARMGVILCNDYTDRATLLRHVDVWDPTSGKGFTTGKSLPGYLPVGDLFVVPRDVRIFAAALELTLHVNGSLRQRSPVAAQIWDLDEMLAATWARRDVRWDHRGRQVALAAPDGTIPARALLMSGTPGGTVFAGVDLRTRAAGVVAWLAGGWDRPVAAQVVEAYIDRARAARTYLQPGDRVTIHVDRLGIIENTIVP